MKTEAAWISHPERRSSDGSGTWSVAAGMQRAGSFVVRYGLASIFVWLGLSGLPSPAGALEICIGVLIAARPFAPRLSAAGSIAALIWTVVTLALMLATPGAWEPSALPAQMLAKEVALLGASLWTAGEALRATRPLAP